ncbi:soluble lytic murein transglycosylase-like protein [Cricetibacter osteomyelitidis]|uniref:Soluble lytic murein transglycosylase-like protein n=1 Tax=Cricetibacter osteomyelitidis TaxID=1521931 RepID=A0A4R2SVD1_9PAST|nr:transglycosylase SLT domain-containing protein [Cricetibacter osteomyelitidis]TCP93440.1 soluble lytic murein transglycosylase-like protein [Cricetibacter osteomyelitidis]
MKKTTALLLMLFSTMASAADLEQQRETYQKISQLLAISGSRPTLDLVNAMKGELKDYPLLPYVEYRITKVPGNLTLQNIRAFQQQYPHFPFNGDLNKQWQEQFAQPKPPQSDNRSAEIRDLVQNPQNLPIFAANAAVTAENTQAVINTFPAFVKSLKETSVDAKDPFGIYQQWADKFRLNQTQITQWRSALTWQLFDSKIRALQIWRDNQIKTLKEDRQTERRLRIAIREQKSLKEWLDLLTTEAKQKDEWQYWMAKDLAKSKEEKKSRQILTALAKNRGFYAMLACQELGVEYRPEMAQVAVSTPIVTQSNKQTAQSASQSPPKPKAKSTVAERFHGELARIVELRYLGETVNVNREWKALLDRVDFNDKLALSQYAQDQQWFDLGVEATIQAKAWDYISLRLPNAYLNWFDLHLKNTKINRTFAMAIARQESAWRPAVTSSANARGLMQLLPSTAKDTAQKFQLPYNRESQLLEPFNNIMLGTAHLQELYEQYGDNRILIASAYNAGPHRVKQWLARAGGKLSMAEFVATIPFYETRNYVQNVLTYDYYYQILQNKSLQKFTKAEYDRMY